MPPGELAAKRIVHLQRLYIILQIIRGRHGAMEIVVPQPPFDPVDVGQQRIADRLVALRHALGILAQHGQAHGDVEPVEHMLGRRGDQLGQERDVLVRLQALLLHQLEQPALGLGSCG